MGEFVDYYSILQVHHLAEQDVLENTYKKLCKKYHPDINPAPEAHERMLEINAAYQVLKDADKRAAYTKKWLVQTSVQQHMPFVARTEIRPEDILKKYFLSLSNALYDDAYELLSDMDKHNVSLFSFIEWQKSVAEIYSIEHFDVKVSRKYTDFLIEDKFSVPAHRFTVNIQELNLRNGTTALYAHTKFVVQKDGKWRVYLGYKDLSYIADNLKHMADTRQQAAALGQWEHYRNTMDVAMGLPNRDGFKERTAPEIYRYERYHRPFSIAVMEPRLDVRDISDALREKILTHSAYSLHKWVRVLDTLAYIGDSRFAVMLAESPEATARQAVRRLSKRLKYDIWTCFDLNVDILIAVRTFAGGAVDAMLDMCARSLKKYR